MHRCVAVLLQQLGMANVSTTSSYRASSGFAGFGYRSRFPAFYFQSAKCYSTAVWYGDVVHNVSRSSLLVAALASGRLDMIQKAMSDRIHQPYRASLVPGMTEILEHATEHGALVLR